MKITFTPPHKFYAIALIMLSYFNINAQDNLLDCKFVFDSLNNCDELFSHSVDPAVLDAYDPVVFNVYFWEIRRSNGDILENDYEPNWDFEQKTLDVVAALNIFYNPYKVYFKYYGYNTIDNDSIYNQTSNSAVQNYLNDPDNYPDESVIRKLNSLNIYVAPNTSGGHGSFSDINVTMERSYFDNEKVSLHEIGHNLGLLHTHLYYNLTYPEYPLEFECEHVTRNPNDSLYNADTHGDRVIDTAAAPNFLEDPLNNCTYTGGTDCRGVAYLIHDEDIQNIMSYAPSACKSLITIGQAIRMREAIEIDCYGKLIAAIRTDGFASFYEPYIGEYYEIGPLPANYQPPLYQPGFDYNFVSCDCLATNDCPLPLGYLETGFTYNEQIGTFIHKKETDYSTITHPNHTAIDILQFNEPQPWRCYDNNNRRPNGGTIIKFNDNVFNTNVTITPQDSTSINNENLVNDLQPGLYNIIEQYEDGDTQETVILKENN